MYQRPNDEPVMQGGAASPHGEKDVKPRKRTAPHRRTVIALIIGRTSRARIQQASSGSDEVIFVDTIDELRNAVLRQVNALTVVAEAKDRNGEPTASFMKDLIRRMPAVAMIGYVHDDSTSADILALANSGIDELIQEGIDDTTLTLRTAYSGSIEGCAARAVRNAITELVPPPLRLLMDYCLQYPREDLSVEGLARAMGCDRKTLQNYSTRAHMPAPSELVMWSRVLLAAAILESTGYPVDRVALQLDFASPSSFRNACRRYTGQRPSTWRQQGVKRVVERFADALRHHRSVTPLPPPSASP
ncbi:MAG: Helix-turn-helix, AraC protein [Gemmatimonadetes bacterium]|nr:Helix-turn-helix, AraC protein [Gemmatimonadota bacterium]